MDGFWRKHGYKTAMATISLILLVAIGTIFFANERESAFPVQGPAAPFELPDIQGNSVSMENTLGKVRLLYFFFASCPDVCPPTTYMLSRVQAKLQEKQVFGSEALILQVTIDPERDTPEALERYAANFDADVSGWKFLRGSEAETKQIGEGYGIFIQKDPESGNFIHSNMVVMIDRTNQIRKRYSGSDLNEELIANDVLRLIADE
jgi:protein SCO1/2